MYYTLEEFAGMYGTSYQNINNLLRTKPLPPAAVLQDTQRRAWDAERIEWYIKNRPTIRPKEWATPWDNTPPVAYWSVQTLANLSGTFHSTIYKLILAHPLEPAFTTGEQTSRTVSWYDPEKAFTWAVRHAGVHDPRKIKDYRVDSLVTRPYIAKILGVSVDTVRDYRLPPPDTTILKGSREEPVWHLSTIKSWDRSRDPALRRTSKKL